jgi:alkylation response protein AidB-like acyl-CoA dehydrogenase
MITSGPMPGPRPEDAPSRPLTDLSEDERLLVESVRAFATAEVAPLVRDMDTRCAMPRTLLDRLFELGLMGLTAPEAAGGAAGTFFHAVLAVEALSRVDPSVGLIVDVQNTLVINALRRWASPEQAARWLPPLVRSSLGAYALSEAGSGSDAFALQTRAVRAGTDFLLTGRKLWITNAAEADVFIVFATVDPQAAHRGITAFIVARDTPGLTVGRREHKLGIRASSTCEVVLDDCRIPADQVIGPVGEGYRIAIETLNEGRIGIGAQMVGLASGALALALRHTRERQQFGQAIAGFQGVQFQLARAATDIEAARLLVYNAARRLDAGQPVACEGAMCKLVASETAERTASLAVNLLGAIGFAGDSLAEKFYRDAKVGQIYEGTSNLLLQTIYKRM